MSSHEKTHHQSGAGSIQRDASGEEKEKRELRKKIISIRHGHITGGYCDTEALVVEEKKLYAILSKELEAAKKEHGYSPDPKFKHPEVRKLELEINGLAFKPKLVVVAD